MPQVIIVPNSDAVAPNPSTTADIDIPIPNSDFLYLPRGASSGGNNLIMIVITEG